MSIAQSSPIDEAVVPAVSAAEQWRLDVLHDYGVLDTPTEAAFDDITRLAALICRTPIALISLVDRHRQWFKSEYGLGQRETPIEQSVCAHAILQDEVFVVPDTLDDSRFRYNPLVTGMLGMRFYAGALLKTAAGVPLGTVCVLDTQPRQLEPAQQDALRALARQTMAQLELRRLLAQAEASNHYRGRLLAIAGHDLKTPLRQAGYGLARARRSLQAEHPARAPLDDTAQALAQIDREFDQLSAVAGAGETHAKPDLRELPLAEVLEPVLATWRRQAASKGLRLRYVPTRLHVRSHRALLSTLVGNLLGNAIKYTGHGSVLLGCRRAGDSLRLQIIDTGIGMDATQARELFGAFRQADPRSEGLGMGLWIVRGAAETLGVEVRIESRRGHGSRIELRLPLA